MKAKISGSILVASLALLAGCTGLQIDERGKSYKFNDTGRKLVAAKDALSAMMQAESTLGREAAANVIARYGLSDNEKLQKYVRLVGATVARKAKRKDVTWRFAVLDEKAPNAFSAPGGYIFVTEGLVKLLNDEAQLAGVLGHEVGHVDEKHAMNELRLAGTADAATQLLGDKAALKGAARGLIKLMDRGYGRGHELDADKFGTLLLSRVGYDTTGLARALAKLAEKGGEAAKKFESRHPPYEARLEALGKVNVDEKGVSLASRFRQHSGS